jgi:DNA-binding beta-propeller fold protein YncE
MAGFSRFSVRRVRIGNIAIAPLIIVLTGATPTPALAADLLVSSFSTNNVIRYDPRNGKVLDIFAYGGGLVQPGGIAVGPDKAVYVVSQGLHSVLRYDPLTGEFINVFVAAGSGGLSFRPGSCLVRTGICMWRAWAPIRF